MFDPNVPNLLTIFRMLLVPVLIVVLLSSWQYGDLLAAGIFTVAASTDALDGWIARRHNITTNFGKLVDPLADKLLVTAALVSLVSLDRLAAWVAMVIIAREFAVTGLRQLAIEQGGLVVPASQWGKLKTLFQVVMVLALITLDGPALLIDLLVYATVAITIASGADYFISLRHLMRDEDPEPGPAAGFEETSPGSSGDGHGGSAQTSPQTAASSHSRIDS